MKKFSEFGIKPIQKGLEGDKIKMAKLLNREIQVLDYRLEESKYQGKCLCIQIAIGENKNIVFTGSKVLIETIEQIPKSDFPFTTTIVEENERYEFT